MASKTIGSSRQEPHSRLRTPASAHQPFPSAPAPCENEPKPLVSPKPLHRPQDRLHIVRRHCGRGLASDRGNRRRRQITITPSAIHTSVLGRTDVERECSAANNHAKRRGSFGRTKKCGSPPPRALWNPARRTTNFELATEHRVPMLCSATSKSPRKVRSSIRNHAHPEGIEAGLNISANKITPQSPVLSSTYVKGPVAPRTPPAILKPNRDARVTHKCVLARKHPCSLKSE